MLNVKELRKTVPDAYKKIITAKFYKGEQLHYTATYSSVYYALRDWHIFEKDCAPFNCEMHLFPENSTKGNFRIKRGDCNKWTDAALVEQFHLREWE